MPELPEVETVKESLKLRLIGKKIVSVRVLCDNIIAFPSKVEFINDIGNQTINDIKRRGKFLVFVLDEFYLLSHLRMEGKYFFKKKEDNILKHEHVIFTLDNDEELRYMDTRKFGKMYLIKKDDISKVGPLKDLGLEPWDKKLDSDYLLDKFSKKKTAIKVCLLDQSIIVGIGNIYADEILFLSKINPLKPACEISRSDTLSIIKYTRETLEKAIEKGGTTIRSFSSINGVHGLFQNELLIHGKDNGICPVCGNVISKIRVGGRGTYFCNNCQK